MIRHCVFIRFRADVPDDERADILDGIAALRHELPGIEAVHVAPNTSPETGMDKGYSAGFIVDFDGQEARDAYLDHPQHKAAGARIVAAAEGGLDGILVYDLEIPD